MEILLLYGCNSYAQVRQNRTGCFGSIFRKQASNCSPVHPPHARERSSLLPPWSGITGQYQHSMSLRTQHLLHSFCRWIQLGGPRWAEAAAISNSAIIWFPRYVPIVFLGLQDTVLVELHYAGIRTATNTNAPGKGPIPLLPIEGR